MIILWIVHANSSNYIFMKFFSNYMLNICTMFLRSDRCTCILKILSLHAINNYKRCAFKSFRIIQYMYSSENLVDRIIINREIFF